MEPLISRQLRERIEPLVWIVLQLAACLHFALLYEIEHGHFFSLRIFADGQYALPYQSRMLTGWIFRYGTRLHPIQAVSRHMPGPATLRDPYEFLFLAISFFALLGALVATQMSLLTLTKNARFSRWAGFLVLYMAAFNLSLSYGLSYTLPYDIPSLFFFCVGVYLVLTRRTLLYYAVFVVATFNRETTCFLTLFFLICEWYATEDTSRSRRMGRLAAHAALQAVIWVAIKSYMTHLFRGNPVEVHSGGIMTLHLAQNIHFLLNPSEWPQLLGIYGFTLPILMLGFHWIGDRRIRTACLLMVPLWFVVMMITGVIVEVRVFDELSALLALAMGLIVYRWAEGHGLRWSTPAEAV
jgi:hypothetical protein